MKKTILLAAAAALLLTACKGQAAAPTSSARASAEQSTESASNPASSSESGDNSTSSEETTAGSGKLTTEELITQLDWSQKARYLDEVTGILDQNQIPYMGTWTISMERADLLLEDGTKLVFLKTTDESGNDTGTELMMINDQFNNNGFQEHYLNQYDVTDSEEYYPETATRLLKQEELWKYNQTDLSIARNEIFARHGRRYEDAFLNAVFSRKTWYQPTYSGEEFGAVQDSVLNSNEKKNLSLLIEMEKDREFRKRGEGNYEQPVPVVSGSWIDFDLDGQKEQILYNKQTNDPYSDEMYDLSVGDLKVSGYGESIHQAPYVASLDGKTTQIVIRQDGPSDDPMADIYVYRNGALNQAGILSGDTIQIYKDYITAIAQRDFFQTYQGTLKYRFGNDTLTRVTEDFYEQNKEAVASATIPLYKEKNLPDISVTLNPGDDVVILGSDYKEWVLIQKKETGEQGWLRCGILDDPFTCTLPDGTQDDSWNLFEGLSFYG